MSGITKNTKAIQLPVPRKCGDPKCGKVHTEVPAGHTAITNPAYYVGYQWQCECNTTLFVPLGKIVKVAA